MESDEPFITRGARLFINGEEYGCEVSSRRASPSVRAPADVVAARDRVEDLIDEVGCPHCRVLPLGGPHVCEHGVVPAPRFEMSVYTDVTGEVYREFTLPPADLPDADDVGFHDDPRNPG